MIDLNQSCSILQQQYKDIMPLVVQYNTLKLDIEKKKKKIAQKQGEGWNSSRTAAKAFVIYSALKLNIKDFEIKHDGSTLHGNPRMKKLITYGDSKFFSYANLRNSLSQDKRFANIVNDLAKYEEYLKDDSDIDNMTYEWKHLTTSDKSDDSFDFTHNEFPELQISFGELTFNIQSYEKGNMEIEFEKFAKKSYAPDFMQLQEFKTFVESNFAEVTRRYQAEIKAMQDLDSLFLNEYILMTEVI